MIVVRGYNSFRQNVFGYNSNLIFLLQVLIFVHIAIKNIRVICSVLVKDFESYRSIKRWIKTSIFVD